MLRNPLQPQPLHEQQRQPAGSHLPRLSSLYSKSHQRYTTQPAMPQSQTALPSTKGASRNSFHSAAALTNSPRSDKGSTLLPADADDSNSDSADDTKSGEDSASAFSTPSSSPFKRKPASLPLSLSATDSATATTATTAATLGAHCTASTTHSSSPSKHKLSMPAATRLSSPSPSPSLLASSLAKLGAAAFVFQLLILLSVVVVAVSLATVSSSVRRTAPPSSSSSSSSPVSAQVPEFKAFPSTPSSAAATRLSFTVWAYLSSLSSSLEAVSPSNLAYAFGQHSLAAFVSAAEHTETLAPPSPPPTTTAATTPSMHLDGLRPDPHAEMLAAPEATPDAAAAPEQSCMLNQSFQTAEAPAPTVPLSTAKLPALERLKAFLQTTKADVAAFFHPLRASTLSARKKLHAVIGNEASDLDSMATSMIYAFFLETIRSDGNSSSSSSSSRASSDARNNATLILPIMNIPRRDYRLRTEVAYMFSRIGISPESLVFMDDLDLHVIHARGLLELTLVDHNMLAPQQQVFASSVVRILDHHSDERHHLQSTDRQVELVGSCSTLLTEKLFRTFAGVSQSMPHPILDDRIAELLLGTILVDTVNLDTVKGKTTPRDISAAHQLMGLMASDFSRTELFSSLRREKFNHAALTSDELLRRDYKEDRSTSAAIGISSISMPIRQLVSKDRGYARSIVRFATARNLKVLAVMNSFFAPDFSRQLTVYVHDKKLLKRVIAHLFRNGVVDLQLTKLNVPGVTGEARMVTFSQSNLKASRKYLMPLLKGLFSGNLQTLRQQLAATDKRPGAAAAAAPSTTKK